MKENSTVTDANDLLKTSMDTFFIIINSMIIFFMQCGFAFLEAGSVRSKNTTNILLKNLLDSFIGCFVYWSVGYAFAFGDGNSFIGFTGWFGTYPSDEKSRWLFQFVFAATSCTIISGSVAERCDIWPYFIYSTIITGFVYPVVSRWAWSDQGWLADGFSVIKNISFQDFGGSAVVHLTGGVAAFYGALFCGPRLGRFELGKTDLPGHSIPLAALGAFILVFGFFAFNGGSQFSISKKGDSEAVVQAIINTIISGMGAAVSSLTLTKTVGFVQEKMHGSSIVKSSWSILTTINGALTGMVSICAGCNIIPNWAAFVLGITASVFYFAISLALVKLRIDDPLDAVAVHAGGGLLGILTAPLFTKIVVSDLELAKQFAVNLVGTIAIIVWTSLWSLAIFGTLKAAKILRVSRAMELKGMDLEKHCEPAYPIDAWKEAWGDLFKGSTQQGQDNGTGHLVSALAGMSLQEMGQENTSFVIDSNTGCNNRPPAN